MADRVHPAVSASAEEAAPSSPSFVGHEEKPMLSPGSYVIQVPKDQVYRLPPPENAHRLKLYSRRAAHRRRPFFRRRCFCYSLAALLSLLLALAVTAAVLYLVYRPQAPSYSLARLSISGLDPTSAAALSLNVSATVRASNPNKKIAFRYLPGGSVAVSYSDVALADGAWPAFFHAARNVTTFDVVLKGSGVRLSAATAAELHAQLRGESVPLELGVRVPVKVKLGGVTSWKITVKLRCRVTVDKLAADTKIVSQECKVNVDL